MAHGHRRPALVPSETSGFVEGSLLPPDPMSPFGEVKIRYRDMTVRVPFTGIEPTPRQLVTIALVELRRVFKDIPRPKVWELAPVGPEDDLEFNLNAR